MNTWLTHDDDDLALLWVDAPTSDPEVCMLYLDAAREACIAYAPARTDYEDIPASWRLAQAIQARNLWNSSAASPTGDLDGGGYGLSTFPLDWQVQQLLRPRRGFGAIA